MMSKSYLYGLLLVFSIPTNGEDEDKPIILWYPIPIDSRQLQELAHNPKSSNYHSFLLKQLEQNKDNQLYTGYKHSATIPLLSGPLQQLPTHPSLDTQLPKSINVKKFIPEDTATDNTNTSTNSPLTVHQVPPPMPLQNGKEDEREQTFNLSYTNINDDKSLETRILTNFDSNNNTQFRRIDAVQPEPMPPADSNAEDISTIPVDFYSASIDANSNETIEITNIEDASDDSHYRNNASFIENLSIQQVKPATERGSTTEEAIAFKQLKTLEAQGSNNNKIRPTQSYVNSTGAYNLNDLTNLESLTKQRGLDELIHLLNETGQKGNSKCNCGLILTKILRQYLSDEFVNA